ncbi:hypothetical protein BSKO_00339 [Bryopsis sp. KO-2023]|nr:hypothetical protein BSKO_00339 [Bryopsis sp. KO-2023]
MGKKGGSKGSAKGKDAGENEGGGKKGGGASQVKVRHILCEKHSKVMEALEKVNSGAKFEEVAREFSEDKARQGGDLGWKRKNEVVPAFAEAAFKLDVGEMTSQPVKSEYGYHLILCEGRK